MGEIFIVHAQGTYVSEPKYTLFLLLIRKEMLCLRTFLRTSVKITIKKNETSYGQIYNVKEKSLK